MEQLLEKFKLMSIQLKLLLLVIWGVGVGYYSWDLHISEANQTLEQAKKEEAQLDDELSRAGTNGAQTASALEQQMRAAEAEFVGLFELLPKDVDVDKLLSIFSDSARETGILLRRFTPREGDAASQNQPGLPPVPPAAAAAKNPKKEGASGVPTFSLDSLRKVSVTIEAEGSYVQLASYFDRILSAPRIIKLENFKMNPMPPNMQAGESVSDNLPPQLKMEAVFTSYVQKPGIAMPNLASLSSSPALPPPEAAPAIPPPPNTSTGAAVPPPPPPELTLPPQGGNP